jgi:hypothetical protein
MTKTIALAALLFGATVAYAQPAPPPPSGDEAKKAEAKTLYEQGLSAYNLGKFPEAIAAFTKAYELSQAPGLLFNIAQSHRLNKDWEKASFFYSTYLRLKPDAANRADVEARIKEMDEQLEKQKQIAASPPTGTVSPDGATTTSSGPPTGTQPTGTQPTGTQPTGTGTPGTPANGTRPDTASGTATTTTAAVEAPDGVVDRGTVEKPITTEAPKLVTARFIGGVAMLKSADLGIPVQPSVGITGGYPLPAGPMTLELGAGFSWTPLPYQTMAGQQQGRMIGVRAVVAAAYPVAPKITLRGELGLGIISIGGLVQGNPISDMRQAQSFTRPNFRFGISGDYAITPNVVAYVSPFGIAFSSAAAHMYGGIREIDVLFGIGYRQ